MAPVPHPRSGGGGPVLGLEPRKAVEGATEGTVLVIAPSTMLRMVPLPRRKRRGRNLPVERSSTD
jgi:hypothetical protein